MRKFVVLLLFLFHSIACAKDYYGIITYVQDGDTATVRITHSVDKDGSVHQLKRQRSEKLRLVEIDAPELDQVWGKESRQALAKLITNKEVLFINYGRDDYKRRLARIFVGDRDVNATMVRLGYAWVFARYATDLGIYDLENQARIEKAGLWGLEPKDRIPPWVWRKSRR